MTEERAKRKLSAVLSADVKGYSRLMGQDEAGTVDRLKEYRALMTDLILKYRGRVVDSPGDNVLAEFASVVDATECAVQVQEELNNRNAELPNDSRMEFRIGINLGDVIVDGERIYGDGINIAARIEGLAEGGGICISGTAYDHVKNKLNLIYENLGEQLVKNVAEPVRVYRVIMEPEAIGKDRPGQRQWQRVALPLVAVLVLTVAAVVVWKFYLRPSPPPAEVAHEQTTSPKLPEKPSIAVLPFANFSGDPEQEYFSDGMTDDLITDLSKITGLFVIARNSVFTYKGKPVKVQQVAEDLGVRYVLEGSIRKAGNQVRINAQLIDATTGHHLWAERYDGVMDNIFNLQDKITSKIVSALALKLTAAEQKHTKSKETNNVEAFDAFLKGWELYQRFTPEDFSKAISLFKRAIDLDPNYGRAYAALALTYWMGTGQGEEWRTRAGIYLETHRLWARHYLQMAMKKPTSVAHQVASLFALYRRQHESAIAEAEKALALEPNDVTSHLTMGRTLIYAGRPQEATNFIKKAMLLDPHNIALPLYYFGLVHFCLGKLEEAANYYERALNHNPDLMGAAIALAAAYARKGRDQEAENMLKRLLEGEQLTPDIQTIMYLFPFNDLEVSDRFADGLIKAGAGLLGETSDYPKISKENKLNGDEIKKLIFGRSIIATAYGYELQYSFLENGEVNQKTSWLSSSGTYWIEGDQLGIQWKYKYEGLKWSSDIYRNPGGAAEMKNEYLYITDWSIISFSLLEKKN
jgi:TolB-like protein/class 3 adenylate cyclase/Flp pilus assembly protein TadD